jgi:arylsulfatase A-like enzyme
MIAVLRGICLGLGTGCLAGLADVLFRFLHPSIGFSRTSVLAVLVLYAVSWGVLGAGSGLVLRRRPASAQTRITASVLLALAVLVLVGGYVNIQLLPSLLDPRSLLFDGLALAGAGGLGWLLVRILPARRAGLYETGAVLLAAVLLAGAALVSRETPPGAREPARPRRDGPDILIVLLDALRPDHTSVYGYELPTTPTLESVAREGAVYLNAYAQSSWTKPSVATIFTGLYPESHGTHAISARLPEELETIPSLLRHHGYHTGVFAENSFVSRLFGFGKGVDRLVCADPDVLAQTVLGHLLQQVAVRFRPLHVLEAAARGVNGLDPQQRGKGPGGLELPAAFLSWVDELPAAPYFAYVHFMKPHAPYIAPLPYDGRFGEPSGPGTDSPVDPPHVEGIAPFAHARAVSDAERTALIANYDERILFGDALFEKILDGLRRRGRLERTAILVLSDHGEEFGEHGLWDHGHSLQEDVTRVVFLLQYPPRVAAGLRVTSPVRLLDVGPTVLDLAGLPPYPQFDGESVLPELSAEDARPRPVLAQLYHGPAYWSNSLIVDGWKLVRTQEGSQSASQVFDLRNDPAEDLDRAGEADRRMQLEDQMRHAIHAAGLHKQDVREMIMDPATRERLRALGYIQ